MCYCYLAWDVYFINESHMNISICRGSMNELIFLIA